MLIQKYMFNLLLKILRYDVYLIPTYFSVSSQKDIIDSYL
jgi:hypothetical protein